MNYDKVIKFWFEELSSADWFEVNLSLDKKITETFLPLFESAIKGELFPWRHSAQGRLAEIIILDQFSRNIFRGRPQAFSQDAMAVALAQHAVEMKIDSQLNEVEKPFLYMPYMHSESLIVHDEAVKLFSAPGLEHYLDYEKRHKVIIEKFKRYPHRNNILKRESSPAEITFLDGPNSSF